MFASIGGSCPNPLFVPALATLEEGGPSLLEDVGGEDGVFILLLLDDGADGADSAASLLEQPPIVPAGPAI